MGSECYYHPDRKGTHKCDNCNKVICPECLHAYQEKRGTSEYRYYIRLELCLPCYYDKKILKLRPRAYLGWIFLITIVLILGFVSINVYGTISNLNLMAASYGLILGPWIYALNVFPILLLIFAILFFYYKFKISNPQQIENYEKKKKIFLKKAKNK